MSIFRKKIFLFLILISICVSFIYLDKIHSAGQDRYGDILIFSLDSWKVLHDSGWPGASRGYVEALSDANHGIRFNYNLKATRSWPWPEIDLLMEFDKPKDLTGYKGVRLYIKGKKREEAYLYFLVRDSNIGILKPICHRFILTDGYQGISLDFLEFKIARDWTPRNPGFNPFIEWGRVEAVGFHKKGRDKERGSISLLNMEFLRKIPRKILTPEKIRSLPPRHFFIELKEAGGELKKGKTKEADAKILVYCKEFQKYSPLPFRGEGQGDSFSPLGEKVMMRGLYSPLGERVRVRGKISPYLYGANWGVWLDFPDKEKVKHLSLKILRAGGPFMDRCNWRSNRYTFPGNGKPLFIRSLDDFIQYCRDIGAEPLIQVNALGYAPDKKGSFKRCMGPDDAAGLIRYLNEEKGYDVRFFEIGNEPFIWHNVHFDAKDDPCSAEEYFEIFKDISLAIKRTQADIDPDLEIKIFGPAISTSWLNWKTLSQKENPQNPVEYFLKRCRMYQDDKIENPEGFRILDVLSFHLFADFKDPQTSKIEGDISNILRSTQTWWNKDYVNEHDRSLPQGVVAEVIPKFKSWIQKYYPGTELAVTEFNIDSESMVDYEPIIKVLYLADLYGIMARYGLDYAAQFCLNSSDHHAALIDDTDNITPLYYPIALYARYFKGVILGTETSQPEGLNIYACNNGSGLVIMAINKSERPLYTEVILREKDRNRISFFHDFAAFSLTCIKIPADKKDNMAECWEYGKRQIDGIIDYSPDL